MNRDMEEKGIVFQELGCRTCRRAPRAGAAGMPRDLPPLDLPASAAVQLPEYTAGRPNGFDGGSLAAPAQGARRQSGSSAPGVQSLSPPCRGSWTSESQGQRSFPPILPNHGRDISHYESLLVVEVPETSDAVFMIHNIIRGAHSFRPSY